MSEIGLKRSGMKRAAGKQNLFEQKMHSQFSKIKQASLVLFSEME